MHCTRKSRSSETHYLRFLQGIRQTFRQRLFLKLEQIGIRGSILGWIKCFLTLRFQRVLLEGVTPYNVPVTSGVPQGTVLDFLLFWLIPTTLRPSLICTCASLLGGCNQLQKDISSLCDWESMCRIAFNRPKSFVMHMSHKTNSWLTIMHTTYRVCLWFPRLAKAIQGWT